MCLEERLEYRLVEASRHDTNRIAQVAAYGLVALNLSSKDLADVCEHTFELSVHFLQRCPEGIEVCEVL